MDERQQLIMLPFRLIDGFDAAHHAAGSPDRRRLLQFGLDRGNDCETKCQPAGWAHSLVS
jgi:hypothetical protein